MTIRLLLLDGDQTLWDHPDLSSLILPLRRKSPLTLVDAIGTQVSLQSDAKETLQGLKKLGVITALVTWNRPEQVFAVLQLFGISDLLDYVKAENTPHKDVVIADLMKELKSKGRSIPASKTLYVDDKTRHLEKTRERVGPIGFLQFGVDIKQLSELLHLV